MGKIVLTGYFGYNNCGDEAMLAGLLPWLRERIDPARLVVLSADPADTRRSHRVDARFPLPTGKWTEAKLLGDPRRWSTLAALNKADAVLWLAGSGVFSDTRGPILHTLWPTIRALRRRAGKLCFLSSSVGPIRLEESRALTRRIAGEADAIATRDRASLALLHEIAGKDPKFLDMSDLALELEPAPEGEVDQLWSRERLAASRQEHWLGVAIPYFFATAQDVPEHAEYKRQFTEAMGQTLDRVHRELGVRTLFLPFQHPWDVQMAQAIAAKMKTQPSVIHQPLSPQLMLGLMGRLDTILAMRLHSAILAARAARPLVSIVYDEKVRAFCREIGQAQRALDYYIWEPERPPLDADLLFKQIYAALKDRKTIRAQLAHHVTQLRQRNQQGLAQLADIAQF